MSDAPCCEADKRGPVGRARRTRLRNAAILAVCAVLLAWLGPAWRIPRELVALGTAIFFAFVAVAAFYRGAPGALPRRAVFLLPLFAAVLVSGLCFDPSPGAGEAVLVEIFTPPGHPSPAGALIAPPALADGDPSIDGQRLFAVAYDLGEAVGRARLGALCGREGPLSEAEAEGVTSPVTFVGGEPLSRLESLGDAVRREMAMAGRREILIRKRVAQEPAVFGLHIQAPAGATFAVLRVRMYERDSPDIGLEGRCEALRVILPSGTTGSREAPSYRLDLARSDVASRPETNVAVLLLVSVDHRVVGVHLVDYPAP